MKIMSMTQAFPAGHTHTFLGEGHEQNERRTWLVIGLFGFSIVTWLLGSWHAVAYDLIGFSAIWQLGRQRISD